MATEEALRDCVDVLKGVKEFAVDLEQHYYRSYLGFCCLMQISTRTHDYLIDTLELRSHMHILNEYVPPVRAICRFQRIREAELARPPTASDRMTCRLLHGVQARLLK